MTFTDIFHSNRSVWHPDNRLSMFGLVSFVAVPVLIGALEGQLSIGDVKNWYIPLVRKPKWAPPNWLFGPVWTILYIMMGVAAWRVWLEGGWAEHKVAHGLYALQLILNLAWQPIFFRKRDINLALKDITALVPAAFATAAAFWAVDSVSGRLFIPYLIWITYAAGLNYAIVQRNPKTWERKPHLNMQELPKTDEAQTVQGVSKEE